jgi:hypothetical protein
MAVDDNLIVKIKAIVVFVERGKSTKEIGIELFRLLEALAKTKLAVKICRNGEELTRELDWEAENELTIAVAFPRVEKVHNTAGEGMIGDIP